MQIHGPDTTVKSVDVGEYHLGAVAVYFGPIRVVTYSEADCDAVIAAFCDAKARHAGELYRPGPARLPNLDHVLPALRAKLGTLALPDTADDAELGHIAIEGTP